MTGNERSQPPRSDRLVREIVLPLATARPTEPGSIEFSGFLGSCFQIGQRAVFLTAGHVIPKGSEPVWLMTLNADLSWRGDVVTAIEMHPSEDIALLWLEEMDHLEPSWLKVSDTPAFQSLEYALWGYPEDVMREVVVEGVVRPRPDLVYSQGHIRRRLSNIELPAIRGQTFYEVSEAAGSGSSGAPMVLKNGWNVVGIYLGSA